MADNDPQKPPRQVGSHRSDPNQSYPSGAAAAVHETSNALTVILGWIERAKGATGENPTALLALERAANHALWARDAMRRALGAELPPNRPPTSAVELATRTLDDLAVEAQRASVKTRIWIDPQTKPSYLAQADVVWQILTNVLLNAISVTPTGGEVALELHRASPVEHQNTGSLLFRVSDQGPGIPEELREKIFRGGSSDRVGGAGIGLAYAKQLAQRFGGDLVLTNCSQGASFELCWPTCPPSEQPAGGHSEPSGNDETSFPARRVLLLEDDDAVVELLALSLASRGATVTAVRTVDELISELNDHPYDTLLVDLSPLSPRDGGLARVIRQTRAINPTIAIIVITGNVDATGSENVMWLAKPFEPRELVTAICDAHARLEP